MTLEQKYAAASLAVRAGLKGARRVKPLNLPAGWNVVVNLDYEYKGPVTAFSALEWKRTGLEVC